VQTHNKGGVNKIKLKLMKTITISMPDNFTDEQVDFIKRSAINQIEAEIKKELYIPQEQIDAVQTKVDAIKTAMGIVDVKPIEEPIEVIEK